MGTVKKISSIFFNKKAYKKMLAYGLLIFILYIFKDFLGIFLLTFIFSYLFYNTAKFLKRKLTNLWEKVKILKFAWKIPFWIIILTEYILFIGIIVFLISNIIPNIQSEVKSLSNWFSIEESINNESEKLDSIENRIIISDNSVIISKEWEVVIEDINKKNEERIKSWFEKIIEKYKEKKEELLRMAEEKDPNNNFNIAENIDKFEKALKSKDRLSWIGKFLKSTLSGIWKVFLALILSFIFIIDMKKTSKYLYKIKESNFSFIYEEYQILMDKIIKSFWLILKAQSMIAFANSILTVIWLFIIGIVFRNIWAEEITMFPYLLTIWLVVFVFWFIPVLGVFMSSIPILLVWYATYDDYMIIVAIWLLIMIIHMIEAYYLNPKIISKFLELPVSLTFIILIISEHLFWLAWLLIWISLFYFIVWMLKDFNKMLEEKNKWKNKGKLKKFFTKNKKELK